MSDPDDDHSWGFGLRLAIGGAAAVATAVALNLFVLPSVAEWFFGSVPVERVTEWDEARTRVTRRAAASLMADMVGPADAPPGGPDAGGRHRDPSTSSGRGGRRDTGSGASGRDRSGDGEGSREGEVGDEGSTGEQTPGATESESRDAGGAAPPTAVPDEPVEFELDRREIGRRLDNPDDVRKSVSLVSRGPGRSGLRVQRLDGYFGQFGLRPGDVVLSVNDREVSSRKRTIAYLMRVSERTLFRVTVRRAGETFRIFYRVPELETDAGSP